MGGFDWPAGPPYIISYIMLYHIHKNDERIVPCRMSFLKQKQNPATKFNRGRSPTHSNQFRMFLNGCIFKTRNVIATPYELHNVLFLVEPTFPFVDIMFCTPLSLGYDPELLGVAGKPSLCTSLASKETDDSLNLLYFPQLSPFL